MERFCHYSARPEVDDLYFSRRYGAGIVGLGVEYGLFGIGTRVLDYGFGRDYLAPYLTGVGSNVWGYDSSSTSVERANAPDGG